MAEPDDPYEWFQRGRELHRRGRRTLEAEAAYRRAIAGGYTEAWLNVGILISARRGRRSDEEAAYRVAMSSDNAEVASLAALRLGNVLDKLDGDLAAAQPCFELARDRGEGLTKRHAHINLGMLLAYGGDRDGAELEIRMFVEERCAPGDDDMTAFCASLASRLTAIAHGRSTRSFVRLFRVAVFRLRRACHPFVAALPPVRR